MNREAWDEQLYRCGSSFLGLWQVLRFRRLVSPVSFFEFELAPADGSRTTKIAQCAVAQKRGAIVFLDRIHILPGYDEYWTDCFSALVEECGADTYFYGSLWNREQPRSLRLQHREIDQTPALDVFRIHVIATRRWTNFDEYLRSVSDSVRYDYQKALRYGKVQIDVRRGWRAAGCIFKILECRASAKKRVGDLYCHAKPALVEAILLVCKILIAGKRSLVALAKTDDACISAFVGVEFGDRLYHITGGTKRNRMGAGSLLMLTIIKYLFEEKTNGELVLGFCWGAKGLEHYNEGTLLYRRKLRVEAVNGVYQKIVCRDAAAIEPPKQFPEPAMVLLGTAILLGLRVARIGRAEPKS